MTKLEASLVFIVNAFGSEPSWVTVSLQRGTPSKRVGPFVGQKIEKSLYSFLPSEDRVLLEKLTKSGLIVNGCIDRRFNFLPDIASTIASHKNLFVRTKRHGSIYKASPSDRKKLIHQVKVVDLAAPPGDILGGCLEITENDSIHLSWRYLRVKDSIPFLNLPNGSEIVKTEDGGSVIRNIVSEVELLQKLSDILSLDFIQVEKGDFSNADLSRLHLLTEHQWSVSYKGKIVTLRESYFDSSGIAWFEGGGDLTDSQEIDYDKIIEAYLTGRRHIEVDEVLTFLPRDVKSEITEKIAIRIATAGLSNIPISLMVGIRKNFADEERLQLIHDLSIAGFQAKLRNYQLDGVLWLLELKKSKFGGILADEMGLGKTVQALAFISYIKAKIVLIVAPASVVPNWRAEIFRFYPDAEVVVVDGDILSISPSARVTIFIMSYQRALRNVVKLESMFFDVFILDEGQFVKNIETKTASALRRVNSSFHLVITGTPIENSIKDLWAHITFTNNFLELAYKKLLKKFPDFGKNETAADLTAKAFGMLIMRRTKKDVELDLPPMVEKIIYCQMSNAQRGVYQDVLMAFKKMLRAGVAARVSSIALEALLRLRQSCSTPALLPNSLNIRKVHESIKIDLTIDIIKNDILKNRKTIVFAQFKEVLSIIGKKLYLLDIKFVRLDGDTVDRELPVNSFQNDSTVQVFLIGFRAGGVGLNLTAAESVILFDPWWNPAAEYQAFARAHRIGQRKTVFVSKLICSDSIEEKMLDLVRRKATLINSIANASEKITTTELIDMIQSAV